MLRREVAVSEESVEERHPPEPDIFCQLGSQPVYFELALLLDSEVPKSRLEALRRAPEQVKFPIGKVGLPERDVLVKKMQSKYETGGVPIQLLLYFDASDILTAGTIPPADFDDHAKQVMLPILESSSGPFQRVWVYERYRPSILWSWP